MKCRNCGAAQPDNQQYCDQCGRKLQVDQPPTVVARSPDNTQIAQSSAALRCSQCQHVNPNGSNFCEECGATLTPPRIQDRPLPPTQVSPGISAGGYAPAAEPPTQVAPVHRNPNPPSSSEQAPTQLYGANDDGPVTQHYERPADAPKQPPRLISANGMAVFFKPGQTSWLIGREDPVANIYPDVDLTPFDPNYTVSRRHAQLSIIGGQPVLVSLTHTNWTKVNGKRIPPDQPTPLQTGDQVEFSNVVLRFQV